MAKKQSTALTVEALKHDASRKNIPSAEFQSLMQKKEQSVRDELSRLLEDKPTVCLPQNEKLLTELDVARRIGGIVETLVEGIARRASSGCLIR